MTGVQTCALPICDLFGNHVVAFELTSALLAIAVIGTVILARKPRKGETEVSDS